MGWWGRGGGDAKRLGIEQGVKDAGLCEISPAMMMGIAENTMHLVTFFMVIPVKNKHFHPIP